MPPRLRNSGGKPPFLTCSFQDLFFFHLTRLP